MLGKWEMKQGKLNKGKSKEIINLREEEKVQEKICHSTTDYM